MLRTINKAWSFILVGFVLFFHFGFGSFGAKSAHILLWVAIYFCYLLIISYARHNHTSYDIPFLRFVRILFNTLFISWLMLIVPEAQTILWLLFAIPITVATATFDRAWTTIVVLLASFTGIYLSSIQFSLGESLSGRQVLVIAVMLTGWTGVSNMVGR